MKTGMLAAEEAYKQITERGESESEEPIDMSGYEKAFENSWVYDELKEVRNLRPSFHNPLGIWGGMAYSGLDSMILKGRVPWTFHHPKEDYAATGKAANFEPIDYPKPDGKLSFDILTSVARTGTNHAENQPVHLRLPNTPDARAKHTEVNVTEYAGLLGRVCPAAVYEYQDAEGAEVDAVGKKFVINSQNCIHCKTCSIKTPTQDITWTVPEGGGGPKYSELPGARVRTQLTFPSHHLDCPAMCVLSCQHVYYCAYVSLAVRVRGEGDESGGKATKPTGLTTDEPDAERAGGQVSAVPRVGIWTRRRPNLITPRVCGPPRCGATRRSDDSSVIVQQARARAFESALASASDGRAETDLAGRVGADVGIRRLRAPCALDG